MSRRTTSEAPMSQLIRSGTVLVVEDDVQFRRDLCEVIEAAGYPVVAAANGLDAIEFLHAEGAQPALILLDLNMPSIDGWMFRRWLEAQPKLRATPLIIITAVLDRGDAT